MANKIIGRTDTSGNLSIGTTVTSNTSRTILLVGAGVDETKETLFTVGSTNDAVKHFGAESPFVDVVKTLIRNGVNNIKGICVGEHGMEEQPYETETAAYEAAYDKSMVNENIQCIILDKSDSALYNGLGAHLTKAEAEDMYRYAVVGVPVATTTIEDAKSLASTINHDRMFVGFPNVVNESGTVLDGVQTAAGIASLICTETADPALPVSGVSIDGFGGLASKFLSSEQDELASAGITVLYPDSGVPTVYRLVTTKQQEDDADSIWHDATTRFIADDVLNSVMARLRANYKRTKNVTRVLDSIKTDVITILENKEALEIIQEFDKSTVSVIRDPDDIYGALVDYEFKVVTPLYTITITQHMKI